MNIALLIVGYLIVGVTLGLLMACWAVKVDSYFVRNDDDIKDIVGIITFFWLVIVPIVLLISMFNYIYNTLLGPKIIKLVYKCARKGLNNE